MNKEKVIIKKGAIIQLNGENVKVTEVWESIGFYYKEVSETEEAELRFCNIMFSTINFKPILN